jgi:hypothetical protein
MTSYYTIVSCNRVTKGEAPKDCFKRYLRVYAEAFSLIAKHTLFSLEESVLHRTTYTSES